MTPKEVAEHHCMDFKPDQDRYSPHRVERFVCSCGKTYRLEHEFLADFWYEEGTNPYGD